VDDLSLAAELVRDAGTLAAEMLGQGLSTEYKTSVSDVVSAADHAAEELVTSRLAEHRADDGLVGEEGARKAGGGRVWYIDPVDGTYNFLSGIPYWCSALGLVDEQGPLVGAVYYPVLNHLWLGGRDCPTTLDGVPVPPLVDRPLDQVSVATYFHPRHMVDQDRLVAWQAVTATAATVRMLGSASVDLAQVASGRLGIFLQANLHPWDWYPGAALVLGAGGVADEFEAHGNLWQIAGNRQAVEDAKAALAAS
jgi:fructose-1,6-bisphosphatase/inositol monophosphatase family enzyme